jgi:hypothetical protein
LPTDPETDVAAEDVAGSAQDAVSVVAVGRVEDTYLLACVTILSLHIFDLS